MSSLADRLVARLGELEQELDVALARGDVLARRLAVAEDRIAGLESGRTEAVREMLGGLATQEEHDALLQSVRTLLVRIDLLERTGRGGRRTAVDLPRVHP